MDSGEQVQPQSGNLFPLFFLQVLALAFVTAQNLFGCACPRTALTRIRGDVRYPQNSVLKDYSLIEIPLRSQIKKKKYCRLAMRGPGLYQVRDDVV